MLGRRRGRRRRRGRGRGRGRGRDRGRRSVNRTSPHPRRPRPRHSPQFLWTAFSSLLAFGPRLYILATGWLVTAPALTASLPNSSVPLPTDRRRRKTSTDATIHLILFLPRWVCGTAALPLYAYALVYQVG